MGVTVRQKQPGKNMPWWVFINHQGKRKAKLVGDKKAAEKLASVIREKLKQGELKIAGNAETPTVKKYANDWLEGYVKTSLKDSTYSGYETFLRLYILPVFGNRKLDEVSRSDVKNFLFSILKKNLSASTAFNVKACLSGIFSAAVEDEILKVNPVSRTGKFIRKKAAEKEIVGRTTNFLGRDEVALLLKTAREYFPSYYPLLLCAVRTGMRIGELAGLEWGDIDFNSRFIEVRRGLSKGIMTTPKNGKQRRVDMSKQLADTLRALKLRRKEEALAQGTTEIPKRVFLTEGRTGIDVDNFRRRTFALCLEKAGIRHIRIHDLRHTFASLLIAQGESLAYVKDQLGHGSIRITVDTYGHLVPGSNRAAVDKLDDSDATNLQPMCNRGQGEGSC